ncbi:hypothetical protein GCM10009763_21000 [Dermacoccus profundi]|uniref:Uncharacterized protein n=1 Tax=Dermacoccus profundi TaxID=322602 RepID=A0ABN2D9R3_9MICO
MTHSSDAQLRAQLFASGVPMFVRPKDRLRGLSGRCAAPLLTVLVVLVALGHLVGVAEGLGSTPVEQVAGSTQADILVTMSVLVLSPVWLAVFAWVLRRRREGGLASAYPPWRWWHSWGPTSCTVSPGWLPSANGSSS